MWLPQPDQVGFLQLKQVVLEHMISTFYSLTFTYFKVAAGELIQVRYPPSRFLAW